MPALLILGAGLASLVGGDDRESLEAIRVAYQANRERLAQGQARLELIQGIAKSPEAARRGDVRDAIRARGSYAFAVGRASFERIYPLGVMTAGTRVEGRHSFSSAPSVRCLTDGKNTLVDDIGVEIDLKLMKSVDPPRERHLVRVEQGVGPFFRELAFPLRPGHPEGDFFNLARYLEQSRSHEDGWELVSLTLDSTYEGSDAAEVVLKRGGTTWTFWIDLEHGAIPRRVHSVTPSMNRSTTLCYDDLRAVAEGVYLPFLQTLHLEDGTTKQVKVESFQFGPPPDSAFECHFETPIGGSDRAHHVRLAPRRVYRLSSLRGAVGPGDRRFKPASDVPFSAVPEMPGEIEPGLSWTTWLGSALLLAMGAGLVAFVVSRRDRWRRA